MTAKRWTAKRRAALVLQLLRGETSLEEATRKHGLTLAQLEGWQGRFLEGGTLALRSRRRSPVATREREIGRLEQKIGELVLANDALRASLQLRRTKKASPRRVARRA